MVTTKVAEDFEGEVESLTVHFYLGRILEFDEIVDSSDKGGRILVNGNIPCLGKEGKEA